MVNLTPKFAKFAEWAIRNSHSRAVLVGTFLGWITWELSKMPERSGHNLAMALIVVTAGSASFVLHALHAQAARSNIRAERRTEVRVWVSLLGCGVALSINGLQAMLA